MVIGYVRFICCLKEFTASTTKGNGEINYAIVIFDLICCSYNDLSEQQAGMNNMRFRMLWIRIQESNLLLKKRVEKMNSNIFIEVISSS